MDTLTSMRAFARVVELGSFAAAARALSLSPAMVTHHVAHLERRTGARLLHRSTRSVSTTDAGRAYYARCVEALAAIDEAEALAAGDSAEPRGTLRVTAPVEFGNLHLAPLVGEFMRRHPQVAIALDLSNRVADLVDEGIDVAVRIARTLDSAVVARQAAVSRLRIVAAPDWAGRHRPADPGALAELETMVFAIPRPWTTIAFTRGDETRRVEIAPRLRSTSSEALRQLACAGHGAVMLPTFLAGRDLAERRLVDLFPEWSIGELAIHVVYANRRLLPLRVRRFVDFLLEAMGPDPRDDPWAPPPGARGPLPLR